MTGGDALRVFDTGSGELRQQLRQPVPIQSVACSPVDRELFATGSTLGSVRLWRLGEEQPIRELVGHGTHVSGLAFSPDGTLLVCACTPYVEGKVAAGEVRLWDVESGRLLRRLDYEGAGASCVAFSLNLLFQVPLK